MTGAMHGWRRRLAELQVAVALLTRLPVGAIAEPIPTAASAAWAFPLAGALVGAIAAAALAGATWLGLPAVIAAELAIAAGIIATGGLHEDGLADTADGFGGGRDPQHRLAIMRDSRIGSFGTLALILAIGLRWAASATLVERDWHLAATAMIALAIASRAGLPLILAVLPPARTDGLGHAAARPSSSRVALSAAIGLVALACLPSWSAVAGALAGLVIAHFALARAALGRIGGQTGDVMGAMQQAGEVSAWLVLASLTR